MARPNVTVVINDESFFIPGTESGSSVRGGMPSYEGLIGVVGTTAERNSGEMTSESVADWIGRLKSSDPVGVGYSADAFTEGNTAERWGNGPTGAWSNEWWAAHNYLQYGGILLVGGTGADDSSAGDVKLTSSQNRLDVVFAATGGQETAVSTIASTRKDCVAITNGEHASNLIANAAYAGSTEDEYNICVLGRKVHLDINRASDTATYVTTNCAADAAGCIARSDKLADPWWSPAGFKRGQILDVIRMQQNPTDAQMDTLYDDEINPIVTFPGEGTVLFGDKTRAVDSSSLSRINVSRLFIYLKRTIGAAARDKLFEFNDSQTRQSFVNAVVPMLNIVKARRGVYDYKVVCDESNNTSSIIDSNQFIADVYIKPTKSINYIRLTFTNKNTADILE